MFLQPEIKMDEDELNRLDEYCAKLRSERMAHQMAITTIDKTLKRIETAANGNMSNVRALPKPGNRRL